MKIALLIVFALGVVAYVIFGLFRKERNGVVTSHDAKATVGGAQTSINEGQTKSENSEVGSIAYKSSASSDGKRAEEADCQQNGVCGINCFCDDEGLQRQMSEEIVYFEDEELDAFRGVAADAYNQEQTDMFAEVLTTLRPQEVADWLHSLQLRGIALPNSLKDEAIMMME